MVRLVRSGDQRNWKDFSEDISLVPGSGLSIDSSSITYAEYKLKDDNDVDLHITFAIDLSGTGTEFFIYGLPYPPKFASIPFHGNMNQSGNHIVATTFTQFDGSDWRIVFRRQNGGNLDTVNTLVTVNGEYPVNPV